MLVAFVVPHQHNGWQTQQVQQVDTDGETRHVENQYQPAVSMWLVSMVFPLQDKPEYNGCKGR